MKKLLLTLTILLISRGVFCQVYTLQPYKCASYDLDGNLLDNFGDVSYNLILNLDNEFIKVETDNPQRYAFKSVYGESITSKDKEDGELVTTYAFDSVDQDSDRCLVIIQKYRDINKTIITVSYTEYMVKWTCKHIN